MTERIDRARAIRDHLLSLISRTPDALLQVRQDGFRIDAAEFKIALWKKGNWRYELMLWAPMPKLREGRDKVLAVQWNADDFTVIHFQRGAWEGDVFSLCRIKLANNRWA